MQVRDNIQVSDAHLSYSIHLEVTGRILKEISSDCAVNSLLASTAANTHCGLTQLISAPKRGVILMGMLVTPLSGFNNIDICFVTKLAKSLRSFK